jgi:hypothetical protein
MEADKMVLCSLPGYTACDERRRERADSKRFSCGC